MERQNFVHKIAIEIKSNEIVKQFLLSGIQLPRKKELAIVKIGNNF